MRQYRTAGPTTSQGNRRSHGFDLAVLGVKLLERTTAQKQRTVAYGPERNVRVLELGDIKRVNALGR